MMGIVGRSFVTGIISYLENCFLGPITREVVFAEKEKLNGFEGI
jgi:hypothetical protein